MEYLGDFVVADIDVDTSNHVLAALEGSHEVRSDFIVAFHQQVLQQLQHGRRKCVGFEHFDENVVNKDGGDDVVMRLSAEITV